MNQARRFHSADHLVPSDTDPVRSVVCETPHAVIIAWQVAPGQRIATHVHPHGQDSWTVLGGEGLYEQGGGQAALPIRAGDILVARPGEAHGAVCTSVQPLVFVSVVTPLDAGYSLV
jgi:quercetin dioxygenase-like cupin family protein